MQKVLFFQRPALLAAHLLFSAFAFAIVPSLVKAATESFNGTAITSTLSFPQFDPSLGSLSAVTLSLSTEIYGEVSVTNTNGTGQPPASGTIDAWGSLDWSDSGYGDYGVEAYSGSASFSGLPDHNSTELFITCPGSFGLTASSTAFLADYTGAGTVSAYPNWDGGPSYGGQPSMFVYSGDLGPPMPAGVVTYNYTVVPEPASLTLLGAVPLGIGLVYLRRRRTKRTSFWAIRARNGSY